MDSKVCKWCAAEKPLSEFPRHPQMRDGHINRCKECRTQWTKNHWQKTKDEQTIKHREWYARAGEAWKAQRRERYANEEGVAERHRQEMKDRYATDPMFRETRKADSRQYYQENHERALLVNAKWREAHREERKAYDFERSAERRRWMQDQKAGRSCPHCGETHPACLDWHHRDPAQKRFNIGEYATPGRWSIEELDEELKKCELICANCHRKLHWAEREAKRQAKQAGKSVQVRLPLVS